MIQRLFILSTILISFALAGCGATPSDLSTPSAEHAVEGEAPEAEAPAAREIATYTVPDLDGEMGQRLVSSLGDQEGIFSAKVDEAQGHFLVTFEPGKADPAALLSRLQTVNTDVALEGVAAADGEAQKKGCGGCPSKAKCPKAKPSSG